MPLLLCYVFLFLCDAVCLFCVYVMACVCVLIDFIGLFCVLLWYFRVLCFWCVCVVCGVLCCCVLFHWFVARVCFVVVVLLSCLFFWLWFECVPCV